MIKSSLHALAGLSLFLFPASALADWQGKMRINGTGENPAPVGEVYSRGADVRMDVTVRGQKTSTYVTAGPSGKDVKVVVLVHAAKLKIEEKFDPSKHGVVCAPTDAVGCLASQGFKKTGTDKVLGHPCDVYEMTRKQGGKSIRQKVWHPTDLKDVTHLKTEVHDGKRVVGTEVIELKPGSLPSSLFAVPSGYHAMPAGISNMMKGLKFKKD